MKNRKVIISCILIFVCLAIFVFLAIKPNTEKSDVEKISEYLENKYSESFSNIEFLSTVQNRETLSCDGSYFGSFKVKDSYKYYYKVYSEKNDLEFYVYIDKTEKDHEYNEVIGDTYLSYLTRRNVADKVLIEVNNTFSNLVEYSYAIKDISRDFDDEVESKNIKEELSRVSKQEEEYAQITFHTENTEFQKTALYFNVNLSFEELSGDKRSDLLTLNEFIEGTQVEFDDITDYSVISIEIHIETSDGYKFVIAGNRMVDRPYVEYYEPQSYDIKTMYLEEKG